jgi:hypothetical protein
MNAHGQKIVDDFDQPELAPVRKAFMDGAYFIYGHTLLQKALGLGYQSDWAKANLPRRHERNQFYTHLGQVVPPGREAFTRLQQVKASAAPVEFLKLF